MDSMNEDESIIEEIVFFNTNRIDCFMALVQEHLGRFYVEGRIIFSSGDKKVITLTGRGRRELREKMAHMGDKIARMYGVRLNYVIFPVGISISEFIHVLCGAKFKAPIPWSKTLLSKYRNQKETNTRSR